MCWLLRKFDTMHAHNRIPIISDKASSVLITQVNLGLRMYPLHKNSSFINESHLLTILSSSIVVLKSQVSETDLLVPSQSHLNTLTQS